jgi:hypothetical protein
LRPRSLWAIYEALPKPERIAIISAEQEAFWRKMDALAEEAAIAG